MVFHVRQWSIQPASNFMSTTADTSAPGISCFYWDMMCPSAAARPPRGERCLMNRSTVRAGTAASLHALQLIKCSAVVDLLLLCSCSFIRWILLKSGGGQDCKPLSCWSPYSRPNQSPAPSKCLLFIWTSWSMDGAAFLNTVELLRVMCEKLWRETVPGSWLFVTGLWSC